jgi:hypothetical protein
MRRISIVSELASWSWILKIWVILYPIVLVSGILTGLLLGASYYWIVTIVGVPVVVIPLTYRNLVGGGCSLRFHICALVKGMLAGLAFLVLAFLADMLVWLIIGQSLGWTPTTLAISPDIYLIWLFSGTVGGFGARIVEVRGQTRATEIKIAGLE